MNEYGFEASPRNGGQKEKVKSSLRAIKFSNVGGYFESFTTHRERQSTHSAPHAMKGKYRLSG